VFSFGTNEIVIIVVLALLLFGPDKIPQLARTVGRFMREFNKYKDIMESTIRMEISQAEGPRKETMTIEDRIAKAGAASTELIQASAAAAPPAGEAGDESDGVTVGEAAVPAPQDGAKPGPADASAARSDAPGETGEGDRG
jgi:TatA/E family protein of Tat protein translocase